MSCCFACRTAESEKVALASCDGCNMGYCQSCADLTSTEWRAVLLKKRSVMFYCRTCLELKGTAGSLHDIIRDTLKALLPSLVLPFISAEIEEKVDSLHVKIDALKDSNIDMVRLLTNLGRPARIGAVPVCSEPLAPLSTQEYQLSTQLSLDQSSGINVASDMPRVPLHSPAMRTKDSLTAEGVLSSSLVPPTRLQHPGLQPRHPSTKGKVIIGSRKLVGDGISAAVVRRRSSVSVSRLSLDVSKNDLRSYVLSITGASSDADIGIEQQTVRSGTYNCYRVEVDVEHLDALLKGSSWPENIYVKKFRFSQQKTGGHTK